MNIAELFKQGYSKEQIEDMLLEEIAREYKARQEADSQAKAIEAARSLLVDAMIVYSKALGIASKEDEECLRNLTTEAFKMQEAELKRIERPKSHVIKTEKPDPDEVIAKFLRGLK